jgi:thioredoxin-like negative regulator of GroEL
MRLRLQRFLPIFALVVSYAHAFSNAAAARASSALAATTVKFKNLDQLLESFHHDPVLLAFTSVHCGPCMQQRHELQRLQQQQLHPILPYPILRIDVEKWPQVGSRFSIGKLPCVVLVQDGNVLLRSDGFITAEELDKRVRETILV